MAMRSLETLVQQRLEYMQLMLTIHKAAPESTKGLEEQRKAVDDMVRYCKQIKVSDVSVSTALSVNSIIQQSSLAQIFKDENNHAIIIIIISNVFLISIIILDIYYF